MRPPSVLAIYIALGVAELACTLESAMTIAAMPTLYRVFNDAVTTGWLLASFGLTAAASTAICGRLGDLYGRKRVLMIVLFISGAGCLISGLSQDLEGVVVGRAFQGVSGAILPICFGLLREHLPPPKVPVGIGIMTGIIGAGTTGGLILSGFIIDHLSWRWIYYVSVGVSFVGIVFVVSIFPRGRIKTTVRSLDILGGVLFAPAIAGVLYAVGQARALGWLDMRVQGWLVSSCALLAIWVWLELRHPEPLIDVRLLGQRSVGLANLCSASMALGGFQSGLVTAVLLQSPTWTQVGFGFSASLSGAILALCALVSTPGGLWSGRIATQHGGWRALIFGTFLLLVGSIAMAATYHWFWVLLPTFLLVGLAIMMMLTATSNLIIEAVPEGRTSESTGLNSVFRHVAFAVGAQIVSLLLATSTIGAPAGGSAKFPLESAFTLAFGYIAVTAIFCLLIALAIPHRQAVSRIHENPELQTHELLP